MSVPVFKRLLESDFKITGLIPSDIKGDVPSEESTCTEIVSIAKKYDLPVYDPDKIKKIVEKTDPDLLLVNNFIDIIPSEIVNKHLCLNVHFGLLPRYRGLHATHWALLNDESEVGYTVYRMTEEIDEGPILHQERLKVRESDDIHTLLERITEASVDGVYDSLCRLQDDQAEFQPQDESDALYVQRRKPEDGKIDWSWPTRRIWNLTRVLQPPYPPAFTFYEGEKLEIHSAIPREKPEYFEIPGHVVAVRDSDVWVKAGDGVVVLQELAYENKDPVPATNILKSPGLRLDS